MATGCRYRLAAYCAVRCCAHKFQKLGHCGSSRCALVQRQSGVQDRKSTRLNSSHGYISYAVFCLKKKKYVQLFEDWAGQRHGMGTVADRPGSACACVVECKP